jgi:4-oxalocrotonate tautomerase
MPVVEICLWEGRDRDTKKRIVEGITDLFVKEGVPPQAVTVILHDIKKENWATAGKMSDEQ